MYNWYLTRIWERSSQGSTASLTSAEACWGSGECTCSRTSSGNRSMEDRTVTLRDAINDQFQEISSCDRRHAVTGGRISMKMVIKSKFQTNAQTQLLYSAWPLMIINFTFSPFLPSLLQLSWRSSQLSVVGSQCESSPSGNTLLKVTRKARIGVSRASLLS